MIGVRNGVIVTGMKELDYLFKKMPSELNHRILGAANVAAAKPLVAAAISKAPQGRTGNLKKSIGSVKVSIRKANEIGTVHVGPRVGGGHKGHHGGLVEFGTAARPPGGWYARFRNAHPTVMPASPFMTPALNQTKDQVLSTQKEFIAVKLQAFMKRTLGKSFIR